MDCPTLRPHRALLSCGFTLIELLAAVLIIGVLVSIVVPNYFIVVEKSRVAEAKTFLANLNKAQTSYIVHYGSYAKDNADLGKLDVSLNGPPPSYGLKYYSIALDGGACPSCDDGSPDYGVRMTRLTPPDGPAVAGRYGAYTIVYDHCQGRISYIECVNCESDFEGINDKGGLVSPGCGGRGPNH